MAKIEFAPLSIPFSRRLQTLSVLSICLILLFGPLLGTATFLVLLITPLSIFSMAYIAFYFLWDFDISARGGRRVNFLRNLTIWKYYCSYFPITLVKTAELDAEKNYIMGYHPHGVVSSGAFGSFATEGVNFSKTFPGITPHLLTLKCKRYFINSDLVMYLLTL